MSTAKTYFISGASRGLGLGYARTLLESSPSIRVVAGVRNPATANLLNDLAALPANKDRLHVVQFDVDDEQSVKAAADKLKTDPFLQDGTLDAIIVNAGVFVGGHKPPSEFSFEDFDANMRTNVRGAILTTQYLLPLVRKSQAKQIFWISSVVASFAGFYSETAAGVAYAMSKSALNMYGLKVSRELASEGFTCVLVHPGYVKTDMNAFDNGGHITTEEAVSLATKKVFLPAEPSWNGRFMDYEGNAMPW
ncbi:dehydrogenase [Rhodotorula diobovata]|uniref:Dehydrogenase n=1 Tax=Rhodotorula diobovata TaxID=5288 RepID=A0A5C5FYJ5_9BASI|nr:dehydrogenase [Rhodotorula diobovata]